MHTSMESPSFEDVAAVKASLRTIAQALGEIAQRANDDGTFGDETSQYLLDEVLSCDVEQARARIEDALDETPPVPTAAWLVVHGPLGERQLLGSAPSHEEAFGVIERNMQIVSLAAPILIIEMPFGSDTVTIHDGDGPRQTLPLLDFDYKEL